LIDALTIITNHPWSLTSIYVLNISMQAPTSIAYLAFFFYLFKELVDLLHNERGAILHHFSPSASFYLTDFRLFLTCFKKAHLFNGLISNKMVG